MTLYDDLKWRGLIKDVAGEDLEKKLNGEPFSFYWGTDPTADSLHVGHYSSLVTAKRLAAYGHHPILLVGGATGLIGDPRPTSEREIMPKEVVLGNVESIKKQVEEAGKAFFFKQWGTWGSDGIKRNKHKNGKILQGSICQAMPISHPL